MAKWQRTEKKADQQQAADATGHDAKQPKHFTGHNRLSKTQLDELIRRIAAPLGDSTIGEIVDHATGKFFIQDGISASGGTDVARP